MSEIIKQNRSLKVSIELSPPNVPASDKYHVIVNGEIVESTPVLALAEAVYWEQCQERSAPARERLAREMAHRDIQAVRADAFDRRASSSRKGGGRGGRGGV
jgi:hypothetical protein